MPPLLFYPSKKLLRGEEYPWIFKSICTQTRTLKEKACFVFLFAKSLQIVNDLELLVLHA